MHYHALPEKEQNVIQINSIIKLDENGAVTSANGAWGMILIDN